MHHNLALTLGLLAIGVGVVALLLAIAYRKLISKGKILDSGARDSFVFAIFFYGSITAIVLGLGSVVLDILQGPAPAGTTGGDSPIVVRGGSTTFDSQAAVTQAYNSGFEGWQASDDKSINGVVFYNPDPQFYPLEGTWQIQVDYQTPQGGRAQGDKTKTLVICNNWDETSPVCNTVNAGAVSFIGGTKKNNSPVFTAGGGHSLAYDIADCSGGGSGKSNKCNHISWVTITVNGATTLDTSCKSHTCSLTLTGP